LIETSFKFKVNKALR